MAYEEPRYHNPYRIPLLILAAVVVVFAIFHTSFITFFKNLGQRQQILIVVTPSPYYTTNPSTYSPTAEPVSLPTTHPQTQQSSVITNTTIPTTGPEGWVWVLFGFGILMVFLLSFISSRHKLQRAIRGKSH